MSMLRGKAALVTGGGKGIGAAIARRLAAEGARVALTFHSSGELAAALVREVADAGGEAIALQADMADPQAVREVVAQTARRFGRLDILVNNAGMGVAASIEVVAMADYEACVAVNFTAVFVAIQEAARRMTAGGRIITIGSVNGDRIPYQGGAIYAATKAAVAGLTRGAARDLGPRGITVNVVQPGPIDTDMNPADGPWADAGRAAIALGHYGATTDVASLVAYLASDQAGFITGASLNVDGGYNA